MKIEEISDNEYLSLFGPYCHPYNSVQYNSLYKRKCEKTICLLFYENRTKIGLIAGIKESTLSSPFSAPFGGFTANGHLVKLNELNDAVILLENYSKQNLINNIKFILPPSIYDENLISKTHYSLTLNGYTLLTDINYHFQTANFARYKEDVIEKKARQNLNKAIDFGLIFKQVFSNSEKSIAYDIIKSNKDSKGRPTCLRFDDIIEVSNIIPIDFFLVFTKDHPIASAIVYRVSKNIVHVIYWGDLSESNLYRPMNFLSYKLFEFYSNQRIEIIDLATASTGGIPNFGLCNFKENIGCTATLKFTISKSIL
ncbi:MAG TPA: hypothetical protein VI413_04190 [Paludibacter sp.]